MNRSYNFDRKSSYVNCIGYWNGRPKKKKKRPTKKNFLGRRNKKGFKKINTFSAARFRSEDIRVMSPARFHCATALLKDICWFTNWDHAVPLKPCARIFHSSQGIHTHRQSVVDMALFVFFCFFFFFSPGFVFSFF